MDYDLEEAEFARVVLSRGARALVVTDGSKFGRDGLVRVCGFDAVTELVTDRLPPEDVADALQSAAALSCDLPRSPQPSGASGAGTLAIRSCWTGRKHRKE